jgi:branched-chain amino acid transport system substrate-binding protein
MSKFRKFAAVLIVFSLVLVAFNSIAFAQAMVPDVPVKIGIMAPITGPAASIGTEQLNWGKLAVEDFNKATGWNVEVVEGDTQIDPAIAVPVAESLISDADVYGVVGPAGSQEVEATEQMFKDARLVHVSGSATRPSLTTTGFDTFFRTVPTDAAQGPTDGNFIYNALGATKLFVIDDKTSYSTGLADEASKAFEADGGTIVGREEVNQDDTDFSTLVTKIGGSGAEVVFFPGQIASQGALLAKQLQEQGVTVTVFGADGFQSVDDFIKGAAGATEGAYVSAFAPDIHKLESSADVVKRYTDEYGDFGTFGPPTYAAATVVLEAMQRAYEAGTLTREAVRDEVAKTNQELSVLGTPLAFDENGDVLNASFYIFQVVGDNFELVPSSEMMMPEMTPEPTSSG